jgi:hypothetical protein
MNYYLPKLLKIASYIYKRELINQKMGAMELREQIISNYINSYNSFDVKGMMADMDPLVKFENIANGDINMALNGLQAFKEQAEQATGIFTTRQQTINSFKHLAADEIEIDITYQAVLAIDLPNGMKKGDELNLTGRSVFKFNGDKIIKLTDIS